ncbi:putative 6-phosphogluconate dehydrogenase [Phaeomoniella chlamydospora]|uniref:Putative 6-phosphogluconate dehydrogenase n=1 Tax=Phaeomoniella chlamydospora TaxID=158046 RepID=A0A0G2E586_PHACM|nr:putative 6-phosphogluconate dehydrogenase [Phaeomoniella chlamydospora]
MSSATQPRLAFIGVGTMAKAEDHASAIGNAKAVTDVSEAVASADIIFMCLGVDAAVQSTIESAVKSDVKGKLFVDCSTIHPDTTTMISKVIEAQGGHFVACPVFGAPAMAQSGQLVCVVAGPADQTKRVFPFCAGVMGRANIDYSGQAPSKATLMKIIGNTFILSMVSTLAEGHVMAEKTGLGVEELHKFVEAMFPGPFTAYSKRMLEGDYYLRDSPLFGVDLARKDAGHAAHLAKEAGTSMKIAEVADGYLKMVKEHMGEKGDIAGIYGAKRKENGLDFENQGK